MNNKIINTTREIHKRYHKTSGTVSAHTRSAQKITKEWQEKISDDKVKCEESVSPNNNEKIDVIDYDNKIAYELKVSGKNTHHEFYKDIFKLIIFNEYSTEKILKLVFISEKPGIENLKKRIDNKLFDLIKQKHNLTVELISI